ncbi:MAG: DUF3024 domain-containing protein [Candidatus Vogelbacteria bacterium]|nr:DUF3024 domain-containing protein [Candidatus Vogelbacteria bacterium]
MSDFIIQKIEAKFNSKIPASVANKIKIAVEKIRGNYFLFEMRPAWDDNIKPWTKYEIAKLSYVAKTESWKLYWHRASGRWELYRELKTLAGALNVIEKDENGCFWG